MTAEHEVPAAAGPSVRDGISRLAQALYRIDGSPELGLVRDRGRLRGRSAEVAGEISGLVDGLWARYPALSEAGERIDAAIARRDTTDVAAIVRDAGPLLREMEADADRASSLIDALGGAWRDAVPRLDALRARLDAAVAAAEALGVAGDPELAAARMVVSDATAQATADPLGAGVDDADRIVERVGRRFADLAQTRASIGADLDAAGALLDELAALVAAGLGARTAAETRIVDAGGLVPALEKSVLDAGDRALRPWLARLRSQAAAGAWEVAAKGLLAWQAEAAELRARAESVAAANRAPLERRNDLRGLLDAFRAKAAAHGLAEDPALTARYRAARDVLYAYRCDVRRAETLVREYGRAIEQPPGGGG